MGRYISIPRWIALIVLAVIAPALGQPNTQAATDEQKAKLDKIDTSIEWQRQRINYDYAIQLDEMRAKKANELRHLEIINPDLSVRGGFVGWAEYIQNIMDLRGVDLMDDPQFAETFRDLHDRGRGLTAVEKFDLTPRLLAIAEDRFAAEKSRALGRFSAAELQLEKERNDALNIRLSQYSEQLKNSELNPLQVKPAGLISGILYSADKPAAIVGPKIVYQEDKLGNVRVVKINVDTVEFDKNGHSWTQKIGEEPSSMWQ
ncbi:MAG: hypothetical protein ABSB25_05560 [Sedimentisphaerales bacterium]|jgi:hypothetical protein